ncbi:Rossmann-like domain-containing protein [Gemmatimonadota bacterium]
MSHPNRSILGRAKGKFEKILEAEKLHDLEIAVRVIPLTPEEAIGNPLRRDFPIIIGKERLIEADLLGTKGQAFTDSPEEYQGTLREIVGLELSTNQERAVFVASLNATLNHLGRVEATVHCKDEDPESCAIEIAGTVAARCGEVSVGLIGLNPAIAERLVDRFGAGQVRITDLCADNIGKKKFGVEVWDGATRTKDLVDASDVIVFTGTTLVNDTFSEIWELIQARGKRYFVYGITAAGVCHLTGIDRICPCGSS